VTQDEALLVLRSLLTTQQLAVLATHGPGFPYTSLVAFTASDDLRRLRFVTPRATRKFQFVSSNPNASMLIDSRSDDDLDFQHAVAATAVGTARELEGAERVAAAAEYAARYPHRAAFVRAPTSALVELTVRRYFLVRRFQNVTEIDFE
jgi:heme iron utilization protein